MEINLVVLAIIVVLAFYIGKRIGSSNSAEIKVTLENHYGITDYNDEPGDERDSWEGGFWDASDPKKLTAHVEIEYEDRNKSLTTRSVQIRGFDNDLYGGVMMGHCQLRNATRTFRFDRIKKCIDLDSGEVITDLKQFLNEKYKKSPERLAEILTTDYIDVLKVFYFLAKADGQYRKEEKGVISLYLGKLVRDDRVTPKMVDGILKEISIPTIHGFKLAIGRVLKGGKVNPELLLSCCQEIVDTQKSVHPMEREALEYIEKRLSSL